jgi:cysteinyl-tRNA synthetase
MTKNGSTFNLYNTRTRQKDELIPSIPGYIGMYCCGPTVYDFAHIGNLRTYIFEDILRRSLEFFGYRVQHVMNITDVGHLSSDGDEGEDKMIAGARARGLSVWDIAAMFTDAFFKDCADLGIKRPHIICKATEHVQDMINLISLLEEKGFTYISEGNVYFDVSKFPRYGELALLDRQELRAGARVIVDEAKRNPRDFVLWFTRSKFVNQAMLWDSPWGAGYPGWHIECSAMSKKYLGNHFDIHCGGVDHIPVHHTNEIAQTEAACGEHPWVNIWMHAEFLLMNKAKMSKSTGGFSTLQSLVDQGFHPLDYRYFCLQAQYRAQLSFSFETLEAARNGRQGLIEKVKQIMQQTKDSTASTNHPLHELASFNEAVLDDLNMPRALAALQSIIKDSLLTADSKLACIAKMDEIFGLDLIESAKLSLEQDLKSKELQANDPEISGIEALIAERNEARRQKNWNRSDEIRDALAAQGIVISDSQGGTTWRRI